MRIYIIFFIFHIAQLGFGASIIIDGKYDDWEGINPIFVDEMGDGQSNGVDFTEVWVTNDQDFFYFRFKLNKEINLQENNELGLYLDYDSNINTGFKINGIGAELRFFFGERFGFINTVDDSEIIGWKEIEIKTAPSVSATEFEVAFKKDISYFDLQISPSSIISFRLEDDGFNGDEVPNIVGGVDYTLSDDISVAQPIFFDRVTNTDLRILTYNIENDQLFDENRKASFERIFQAIDPDIVALQEVRDFNSTETKALIEEFLPDGEWYHSKTGFDIVTISRYPILETEFLAGNGAFYIDVDGKEILLINCHLPCCDNNSERQGEVDAIMAYVRDVKQNGGSQNFEEGNPIFIVGDMNFIGFGNQPYTFATGDIFNNGQYGIDFKPDWDETDLKDVDAIATNHSSNITWYNRFGGFFPAKLDWIFYTDSKIRLLNSYALFTTTLSNEQLNANNLQEYDVEAAADHLPVVADFSFDLVSTDNTIDIKAQVSPNPFTSTINISPYDHIDNVKLINIDGKSVEINYDNGRISIVNPIPSGQYFIIIDSKDGSQDGIPVIRL